ncbi:hypothetical protein AMELA_G00283470, partial [Ameiurus melas]
MDDAQVQAVSCYLCSLSYTSQIDLHKHIRRYHYEEYKRLLQSGEFSNPVFSKQPPLHSTVTPLINKCRKKTIPAHSVGRVLLTGVISDNTSAFTQE